jgi:hypothetical protein
MYIGVKKFSPAAGFPPLLNCPPILKILATPLMVCVECVNDASLLPSIW